MEKYVFKRKKGVIFWGLLIIALGAGIILYNSGLIQGSLYLVIMTVVMAAIAVRSLMELTFTPALLGIGHLAHLYSGMLGIPENIKPWMLIIGSTVIGIGLDIIFSGVRKGIKAKKAEKYVSSDNNSFGQNAGDFTTEGSFKIENSFGEQTRYVKSEKFVNGKINNGFGKFTIYFEDVTMENNEAFLFVENGFGNVNVYIPSGWALDLNQRSGMGQVNVVGNSSTDPNAPKLHMQVENGFGEVDISVM